MIGCVIAPGLRSGSAAARLGIQNRNYAITRLPQLPFLLLLLFQLHGTVTVEVTAPKWLALVGDARTVPVQAHAHGLRVPHPLRSKGWGSAIPHPCYRRDGAHAHAVRNPGAPGHLVGRETLQHSTWRRTAWKALSERSRGCGRRSLAMPSMKQRLSSRRCKESAGEALARSLSPSASVDLPISAVARDFDCAFSATFS